MKTLATLGAVICAALAYDTTFSGGPIGAAVPVPFPAEAERLPDAPATCSLWDWTSKLLGTDLLPIICTTPAEIERREWSSSRFGPKLIFAIKEAVYKSYAPATGEFLDFQDVGVRTIDQSGFSRPRLSIWRNLWHSAVEP